MGGTWPRYFVLKGVDYFSIATCVIDSTGSETILEGESISHSCDALLTQNQPFLRCPLGLASQLAMGTFPTHIQMSSSCFFLHTRDKTCFSCSREQPQNACQMQGKRTALNWAANAIQKGMGTTSLPPSPSHSASSFSSRTSSRLLGAYRVSQLNALQIFWPDYADWTSCLPLNPGLQCNDVLHPSFSPSPSSALPVSKWRVSATSG